MDVQKYKTNEAKKTTKDVDVDCVRKEIYKRLFGDKRDNHKPK